MFSRLTSPLVFFVVAFLILAASGMASEGIFDDLIVLARGTPVAR